jgi:hypothetical protein
MLMRNITKCDIYHYQGFCAGGCTTIAYSRTSLLVDPTVSFELCVFYLLEIEAAAWFFCVFGDILRI